MRTLTALLLAFVLTFIASAAEPWLKAGDVVALVGGEDMVALAEEGWLETLVTWAQPKDRIRFRSLAWEGDTVFEQRRDLNYPTLEAQLDRMGATVVICQFGKMESFAGKEGVAAFTEAYEKLLARLSGENKWRLLLEGSYAPHLEKLEFDFTPGGHVVSYVLTLLQYEQDMVSLARKRRIALVLPPSFGPLPQGTPPNSIPNLLPRNADLKLYHDAIRTCAAKLGARVIDHDVAVWDQPFIYPTRDGVHLTSPAIYFCMIPLAMGLGAEPRHDEAGFYLCATSAELSLRTVIRTKNRLWFHYTRPQNWAFLAGNRTNQPSSRDHLDPTRRWFPEEMEQWLPLIEAKEQEIWKLASAPR